MQFPQGFLWGGATASYQVEGAAREGGRGETIWDRFSHTPGKVLRGDTGDVACDHYHRYIEDIDLMAELGLQTYRFSIAWSRLFPDGTGPLNQEGLNFYKRLVDKLLSRGIKPMATLYHWDLPQALEEKRGWANRETAYRFGEYADAVFRNLDGVDFWATHNEPWCAAFLGYWFGVHAPGVQDVATSVRASHHLLLSHGLAVDAFRASGAKGQVGIVLNPSPAYPATDSPADRAAALRADGFQNRWFLDPLLKGAYPADMLELFAPTHYILPGDLETISRPIDFLGVNYYSRQHVKADPTSGGPLQLLAMPPETAVTDMGWEIVPDCLHDLLLRIKRDYGDIPLYITENGCAVADAPDAQGRIRDTARVDFMQSHLNAAARAIADGVNLKGYYAWSFMDNYEWAWGYTKRFGIVYVDYATQRRIPKESFHFYRDVIKRNGTP